MIDNCETVHSYSKVYYSTIVMIVIVVTWQDSPSTLKTAISPDVLREPKWTPDTRSSVSLELNCEYWVYFQVNLRMSALNLMDVG